MLTPADQALIRRDTAIPGLELTLDPEAFVAALGPQLTDCTVTAAAITYVRYKPGRDCLVGYRLQTSNGPLDVYATAYGPDAAIKVPKRLQRLRQSERSVRPVTVWPEAAIVVHVFPNDEVLKLLPRIANAESRSALLQKMLPDRPGLWGATLECLRYKPLRRYVARLRGTDNASAVLKLFADREGPNALVAAKRLQSTDTLRIRQPLSRSHSKQLLVLEWLEGEILADLITDPSRAIPGISATGAALWALHRQSAGQLPTRTPTQDAGAIAAAAEWLAQVYPPLARECQQLAGKLAERLNTLPVLKTSIHGDFHSEQVLASGSRITLLDLDRAARGHPAIDLGWMQAHLERDALAGLLSASDVHGLCEALVDGYAAAGGIVEQPALAIYTAAGLMRLAPEAFRRREPEWPSSMAALIRRAEALLKPSTPTPASMTPADDPVLTDPGMPFFAQAVDATHMREALSTALRSVPNINVAAPLRRLRVLRHKPGRRCLIEYTLTNTATGQPLSILGKARAKGLDRKTYALYQWLWHHGFGPDSPDHIQVPEPLGLLPTLHMWLQRRVSGVRSTTLLTEPEGVSVAEQVADALYKLHRHGPIPTRRHSVADELGILATQLSVVVRTQPRWRSRIERILEACRHRATSIPPGPELPIHRDFYPDQVLIDGPRTYLLDLDLYAHGDAAVDVGNFVAHAQEYALRLYGDAGALDGPTEHFVAHYLTKNTDTSRDAVRVYTTLSLARHIAISQRIPKRRPLAATLMDLCEQRLGIATACQPHTSTV